MCADLTDDAVAKMRLAQGHATLEAHCGNIAPRSVAGHSIRTIRAFANGMPSTLAVGHVPRNAGTAEHLRYRYWLHYAEGSAMPPMLLSLVFSRLKKAPMPFFARPVLGRNGSLVETRKN